MCMYNNNNNNNIMFIFQVIRDIEQNIRQYIKHSLC